MGNTVNKVGKFVLLIGILLLAAGLVCLMTMTFGARAVPVLLFSSILVNAAGITMIRHGK